MSIEFEGKKSVITPEGVFIIGTYDENGTPDHTHFFRKVASCLPAVLFLTDAGWLEVGDLS